MRTKYTFTVITACYNVENYLDEAVQSLLRQDVGFEEHIQLVLVDDGSTDGTGAICDKYALQYPDNIEVIHQSNAGVSVARNAGLERVRGEYVNFMDADDKFSLDSFSKVKTFLQEYGCETGVTTVPTYFFEGRQGSHPLNYIYKKGSRVIDLEEEWQVMLHAVNCSFFSVSDIRELRFSPHLAIGEDTEFIQRLLLKYPRLGIVSTAKYFYRKRLGEASALQSRDFKKSNYIPFADFLLKCMALSVSMCSVVKKHLQAALFYQMQHCLVTPMAIVDQVLCKEEKDLWVAKLLQALSRIDYEVIMKAKNYDFYSKLKLLSLQHHKNYEYEKKHGTISLGVSGVYLLDLGKEPIFLHGMHCAGGALEIEGSYILPIDMHTPPPLFHVIVNGEKYACTLYKQDMVGARIFGEASKARFWFKATIPTVTFAEAFDVVFAWETSVGEVTVGRILTERLSPLSHKVPNSYCICGGYLVRFHQNKLLFTPCSRIRHLFQELRYLCSLASGKPKGAFNALRTRLCYWLTKPFVAKDIWLISDRINKADDNGEAFYNYINANRLHPHNYFVILENSEDYGRLKKNGKVVRHLSLKHQVLQLHAQCIISSHADDHVTLYAKPHRALFFMDLLQHQKHIFLQHGIIMNDVSGWLNSREKDLSLFLTSAKGEYEFIANNPKCGFGDKVVRLLGMPRFDRRVDEKEKLITIAPTWRKQLSTMGKFYSSGQWSIDETGFVKSTYYRFYQSLLTDRRLMECAERTGYRLQVMLHPNAQVASHLFQPDPQVSMLDLGTSYQEIYRRSALMLTDYSSCVFDFAYLRKPVLYCQFDQKAFFSGHWVHGYFSYEEDGFGEVETTLEGTVDRLIEYMENGCRLKPEYRERIDSFFAFNDRNNCKRVYEAILDVLKHSRMMPQAGGGRSDIHTARNAVECLMTMEDAIQEANSQDNKQLRQSICVRLLDRNFWKVFKGLLGDDNVRYRFKRVLAQMPWEKRKLQVDDIVYAIKGAKTFLPNRPNRKGLKELCEYARRMASKVPAPRVNVGEIIPPVSPEERERNLVSIIVPVYNVEKYLRCCLDSLSGQTHKNLEIICVDDGSTDSSPIILSEAAAKDPRIRVVRQENGGLSAARNTGLRHATAPYITFVDSDDWLEPDAIGKALAYMLGDARVDMVCYLAEIEHEDVSMRYEQQVIDGQNYHACKYKGLHAMDASTICNSTVTVWNKMLKKELIDKWGLQFPPGLAFEDNSFFTNYALHVWYTYFIDEALYHYRQRLNSIMGKAVRGKVHNKADRLGNFVLMYKHYEKHGALEEYKGVMNKFLNSCLFADYRSNDKSGKKFVLDFATKIALQCDPKLFTPGLVDKLRRRRYHEIEQLNYYAFRQKLFSFRKRKGKRIIRLLGLKIRV